jgi:hypothetical protein
MMTGFKSYLEGRSSTILVLIIPLSLSAFIHLYNPVGFPAIHVDEGTYVRWALHYLAGLGPQERQLYDHPYFGQIFLAGVFKIIGYPNSLHPSVNGSDTGKSIETLWLVPRVLMGLLAVVDTFLIYKISEYRYNNRKVAFIASILFAVMPITWLTKRIWLDNIQLPFLLSSILFAVYPYSLKRNSSKEVDEKENRDSNSSSTSQRQSNTNSNAKKNIVAALLSGIFLGLAIFTKIPAITMIPMVGFLILMSNNSNIINRDKGKATKKDSRLRSIISLRYNKNLKILGLWFTPVILIPAIWPAYAISVNQFDDWLNGVYYQTNRTTVKLSPLFDGLSDLFRIDPVLMILGAVGFIYMASVKRDIFLLLWIIPFLIFYYLLGHFTFFYFNLLIPAFCIAAAGFIVEISNKIKSKKLQLRHQQQIVPFIIISVIGIFGFISTILLITTDASSFQIKTAAFVAQYLNDNKNISSNNGNDGLTIISSQIYSWIFRYVFNDADALNYRDYTSIKSDKFLLVLDRYFSNYISHNAADSEDDDSSSRQSKHIKQLELLNNSSKKIATFKFNPQNIDYDKYPYSGNSMAYAGGVRAIIRTGESSDINR